ncbi:MAG: short-chain fatty acyl-CoA regulator family protein, partial [Pseudomonadota bacterium]
AEAIGISASYLNLIEHNRRKITVPLLFKIAGYFRIEPGELADGDDGRLVGDLMELFGDDLFVDSDLTNQEIRDLAFSNPVAARAVLRLFDKYREMSRPGGTPSITGEGRGEDELYHGAPDAVSDFIQERSNYFPQLEEAAERVRHDIDHAGGGFEQGLRAYFLNVFGVECRRASLPRGMGRRVSDDGRLLEISELLPPETAIFSIAHEVGLRAADQEISAFIEESTLPDLDASALARTALGDYFAAALAMPYQRFLELCEAYRYDVDRIALGFSASFEQVCHRMTTLQRPGAQGIPLHLVRTDIAGNISKRFSLSGIHIPRHSGACPRWNVYSAFLQPGRINVQLSQMPEGETYFCIARSFEKGGHRHNAPRRHLSIGLGCSISDARRMVYSDGIDLTNSAHIVPIGVGCRICPRLECEQRAHPPAGHRFNTDNPMRGESLYGHMS